MEKVPIRYLLQFHAKNLLVKTYLIVIMSAASRMWICANDFGNGTRNSVVDCIQFDLPCAMCAYYFVRDGLKSVGVAKSLGECPRRSRGYFLW